MEMEMENFMENNYLSAEEIMHSFAPLNVLYLKRTFF